MFSLAVARCICTSLGMFVIFISHQWLSFAHPDPHGQQVAVLRSTLLGVIAGSLCVEPDTISIPAGKYLTMAACQAIRDGYIFFDWFAIPQITAREGGVNEDVTRTDAALAVQSIPAYVEAANLFMALVPGLVHADTGMLCNYISWQSRGWCHTPSCAGPVSNLVHMCVSSVWWERFLSSCGFDRILNSSMERT